MSRADWSDVIGASEAELRTRFGDPTSRREVRGDLWLVFATPPGPLRVRCRTGFSGAPRVVSWTLRLARPCDTLADAAAAVGLWPAASPDAMADGIDTPLVRRPLQAPGTEAGLHSLTVTVRDGRFTHVSVFDEPPDWV